MSKPGRRSSGTVRLLIWYILLQLSLDSQGSIATSLRPTAEKLFKLKSHLERLSVTQAWSLRETDLYDYITQVQEIDRSRVGGKFVDSDGGSPEDGQAVSSCQLIVVLNYAHYSLQTLLYLVRKCYMHIFTLIVSSEVRFVPTIVHTASRD